MKKNIVCCIEICQNPKDKLEYTKKPDFFEKLFSLGLSKSNVLSRRQKNSPSDCQKQKNRKKGKKQ